MRLQYKLAIALLSVTSASAIHAQQFITALNIDGADGDVDIQLSSPNGGTLVTDSYNGASVQALTELGVNKVSGGGRKSGSGRGKAQNKASMRKGGRIGGKASAQRTAAARSASARKAARTRAHKSRGRKS